MLVDQVEEYSLLLWSILRGEGSHDLFAQGLHVVEHSFWNGRLQREIVRSNGDSRVVVLCDDDAHSDCPFVLTDGPIPELSFRFSVHALQRDGDLPSERRVEFRAGVVAWPYADRPGVSCLHFGAELGAHCSLDNLDFDDDYASFRLYRDDEGHACLWHETRSRFVARSTRAGYPSQSGAFGVFVWYNRNHLLMSYLG